MKRANFIEFLWMYVEAGDCWLGGFEHLAVEQGYLAAQVDSYYRDGYMPHDHWTETSEDNYKMGNGTFALLILAAEGELE